MKIKRILDLSQPLYHNCPGNPLLPPVKIDLTNNYAADNFNMESLQTHTHVGTHIDAPWHMLEEGKTIDEFPVGNFLGEAIIIDLCYKKPSEPITPEDLSKYSSSIKEGDIILFYTGWGEKLGFTKEYVFQSPWLREDGAEWLVSKKIKGIGIDHLSISGMEDKYDRPTHQKLLAAGIWILEGLCLTKEILSAERWFVVALPLLIKGASGAPARAVAIQIE